MKRYFMRIGIINILIILTLTSTSVLSQGNWEMVFENVNGGAIWDMSFVAGEDNHWNTGWACDTDGTIYKTTNGGDTWTGYTDGLDGGIRGVDFIDENIGYAASTQAKIYKTTDGGINWTEIYNKPGTYFGRVRFEDEMNGVVSGSPPMYTNDGGNTWHNSSGTIYDGVPMDYGSISTYYVAESDYGYLRKSTNSGQNWSLVNTFGYYMVDVKFYDNNHGITGGGSFTFDMTTDGGATWTTNQLNDGNGDFRSAGYYDTDTVYVCGGGKVYKTSDGGNTWDEDLDLGSKMMTMQVTPYNIVFVSVDVPGSGYPQIWRRTVELNAQFTVNEIEICEGSNIHFTDLSVGNIISWDWTFEGGTPATSTDQNPTVTYNTPGFYDVSLTVTNDSESLTELKEDYIAVLGTPAKADIPEGDDEVCAGIEYYYSTTEVIYAQEYEWEINPSSAGTVYNTLNNATVTMDVDFTGDFSLRVRAVNMCDEGEWSDDLEGVVYPAVSIYNLEGGGAFCVGSEGAELILSGSDLGVDYELFLDAVATGIIASGTGSEISFGNVTEEGYYEAVAFTDNCDVQMNNQVYAFEEYVPEEPAAPIGPSAVCDDETSDYTSDGTNDSDSYSWTLLPEEAGTISGEGLNATVTWNTDYVGTAMVSISGINDCGTGEPSSLDVTVGAANPMISGENIVCDFSSEIYEVEDHEGSNYTWEVTGGIIAEGQGTYMITVDWNGEGNSVLNVLEETQGGCEGESEEFEVLIDDCTGVGENQENSITIYPNPASDFINMKLNSAAYLEFSIYNSLGQVELQKTGLRQSNNKIEQIDLSSLNKGLYIIRVKLPDNIVVLRRFVKN